MFLQLRLYIGASYARLARALRRRNVFTVSGSALALLSLATAVIIVGVPMFLESDKLLQAHNLPTSLTFHGRSWHINLAIIVTVAYLYQFLFKTIENSRSATVRKPHELKRRRVESRAIGEILEALQGHVDAGGRLLAEDRLIQAVLEAVLLTVAENVGGYAEMEKLEANLMVRSKADLNKLRVIARFGNTRPYPIEYSMEQRSFCAALWQGDETSKAAGNIALVAPESGRDVPYKDILRLPIRDSSGNIAAAVSIDSSEAYHFPRKQYAIQRLESEVAPQIALLRMILEL